MARSQLDVPQEIVSDALLLLKRDHKIMRTLFLEFELANEQQVDPIARRICKMVRVHAQIEEEIFYPAAASAIPDSPLIAASVQAHGEAQRLIMRLESITSSAGDFTEVVAALADIVRRHMTEEEDELFPQVARTTLDLVGLGIALIERRDTLMRVLGLHEDDEVPTIEHTEEPVARESRART